MTPARTSRRRLLLAAPLLLAGCQSLLPTQTYHPRTDWVLAPPPPPPPARAPHGPVLMLRALNAGPDVDQRGIARITPEGTITYGYYNRWAADPAAAATAALDQWLRASGQFSAVISPASRLAPDLIVEGTLTRLAADPQRKQANAALTLTLMRSSADGTTSLRGQTVLSATAPIAGPGIADDVSAVRAALADVLGQAVAFASQTSR